MKASGGTRDKFGSKLSAVLVAAGCSVGLGTIWRFPFVVAENGGGAFLLVYLACVILIGVPVMLAEFVVGRGTHLNAVGAYQKLDKRWSPVGYAGVLAAFLIMGSYFVVSGWTAEYLFKSVIGDLSNLSTPEEYQAFFDAHMVSLVEPILYAWIFIAITHFIIVKGVTKGIEKFTKVLMPLLFLILIVLAVNSLLMPNSFGGLKNLFYPDFSKLSPSLFLAAIGQAFFSLSIGLGCLIAYSSYFDDHTDLRQTAVQVTAIDTVVALLAGVVIFPAAASVGIDAMEGGPELVFVTLPGIFNTLPFSALWSSIFFMLLVVAALTSTISLHEVVTLYFHEQLHMSRKKATYVTTVSVAILATFACLSLNILSSYTIFELTLFDFLDTLVAKVLLPVGGLFTCVFVGWRLDRRFVENQLLREGEKKSLVVSMLIVLLKYICPFMILAVLLNGFDII